MPVWVTFVSDPSRSRAIPEVEDLQHLRPVTLRHDEDILGLEIAVDDPRLMRGGERVEDLLEPVEQGVDRVTSPREAIAERLSLEQLHGDEERSVLRVETRVVDLDDPVVTDLSGRADLTQETRACRLVLADVLEQDLERDLLLGELVLRDEDRAHPTLGDERFDEVLPVDQLAGLRQARLSFCPSVRARSKAKRNMEAGASTSSPRGAHRARNASEGRAESRERAADRRDQESLRRCAFPRV